MRCHAIVRPGFRPLSIALMVIAFMIAWPLGLAMLAWMIWGDRLAGFAEGVKRGFADAGRRHGFPNGFADFAAGSTGNAAFDSWRAAELERLESERRRLDEERREFEAYLAQLRRARDQEEFDRFRAERARRRGPGQGGGWGSDI